MLNKKITVDAPVHSCAGMYKIQVLENGKVVSERPWQKNMITDYGLNYICSNNGFYFANMVATCSVGTGTTPTYVDSGVITATSSGTTVTASSGIFTAGMVGQLIKFDSGEERYITAYTSSTQVTIGVSLTIASATLFTVWAVNQQGLVAHTKFHSSVLTGSGNCGRTDNIASGYVTYRRTFDFSAEASNINYTELGWSNAAAVNTLFSRSLISGGSVSVLIGQQLRVIYDLTVTFPTTSTTTSWSISGWPVAPATNTNCTYFISDPARYFAGLSTSNSITSAYDSVLNTAMLPGNSIYSGASSVPALGSVWVSSGTNIVNAWTSLTIPTYVNNSFYRDFQMYWQPSVGNSTSIRTLLTAVPPSDHMAGIVFEQNQTKANTNSLTLTIRRRIGRNLVNP